MNQFNEYVITGASYTLSHKEKEPLDLQRLIHYMVIFPI